MADQQTKPRIRDRNTSDLLVLMVAGTICFTVISGGTAVIILEIVRPDVDTSAATRSLVGIVNTLIGLLAGFLAGKTGSVMAENKELRNREEP
jgi:hypothetical protein